MRSAARRWPGSVGGAFTAFFALTVASAAAHPGVGIVQDRAGDVFFTDLKQVWRVDPGDRLSVAVPRVHTHELCIDGAGSLLGEHLWYEGDATSRWKQRLWRRSPAGTVDDLVKVRRISGGGQLRA